MKFDFDYDKCSDVGLVVKHGNKDNVVLFFDEIEEAACYRANLFRTDINFGEQDGFLKKGEVTENPLTIHYDYNGATTEVIEQRLKNGDLRFIEKNLVQQITASELTNCTIKNAGQSRSYYSNSYKLQKIREISFNEVKFISSLESGRNDLFINIDFLPCGYYFVILQAEDRNGNIIKESIPYYFKIDKMSNDDILKALKRIHGSMPQTILG